MVEPAVTIEGLLKRYGDVVAVNGLTLSVPRGSVYGLLGPDGAGKTSALRCLTRGTKFDGGRAFIAGLNVERDIERIRPVVGYMPQRFALYADLTVMENLELFSDLFTVPRADRMERLPRLMAFSRLTRHERKLAGHLSGGMKQKLALCTALVHNPGVLLLDEPTTGVDPVSRRDFWEILLELKKQGVAILVSTPYMDEAERCDTVGMMVDGRILVEGAPAELKSRFPHRLVAVSAEPLFAARRVLDVVQGVHTTVLHGDAIHLVVDDPAEIIPRVTAALEKAGLGQRSIGEVAPGLEDVFVYEIRRCQGQRGKRIGGN